MNMESSYVLAINVISNIFLSSAFVCTTARVLCNGMWNTLELTHPTQLYKGYSSKNYKTPLKRTTSLNAFNFLC